jgi:uncharacterized protein (DUF58 family)
MIRRGRALGFLSLAAITLVAGLATGRSIWFTLTYVLALLLIGSFLWAWVNIRKVRLSRLTRSRRTQVGQPLEERFIVRNTSILPKLWLEVRDYSTMPGHNISRVVDWMRPRDSFSWRTNTISRRRGRYQLGPVSIRTSDPFGLFLMQRDIDVTGSLVVYPMTVDIHEFALPIGSLSGGDALRRRTFQVTTNAAGVRDYVPGDSFGRIHWKSSARRNRLIVKEFELDPMADIWIVPDMYSGVHFEQKDPNQLPENIRGPWALRIDETNYRLPNATEEYCVTIAASLAQYFLRRDRAVGMLAQGQTHELLQPDRGERQFNRILETLAVLRAEGHFSLADLLTMEIRMMQRGTTLIVVTPTVDPKWALAAQELSRRGTRIVTVLVDPASFGGEDSAETVHQLLLGNAMMSYLINRDDDLTARLSTPARLF